MWILQLLLYSFLIPTEFKIDVGVFSLSAYRILLIFITPWLFYKLLFQRRFRWRALDSCALLICIWPIIALALNTGLLKAIESGGIHFLETSIPFFTARQIVYKHSRLVTLSKTILIIASIMALTAIPEAITGKLIIHSLAPLITGNPFPHTPELRLGIWRSYGPTDHPIILGSICAAALPLGLALSKRARIYFGLSSLSMTGVLASASSGPLLSIVVQAFLFAWSRLMKGVRLKWWLLIIFVILVYIIIDILSNRDPFRVMFSYLLFNEHNGYVRYNMWINSFFLVGQSAQSFFLGYGFSTEMMALLDNAFWTTLMSSSVDSYWLVILLRYGVPMLAINVLLVFLVLRQNVRSYLGATAMSRKSMKVASGSLSSQSNTKVPDSNIVSVSRT